MEQTQKHKQTTPKANTTSPSGRNVKALKIPLRARKNKKAKSAFCDFFTLFKPAFLRKNQGEML